MSTKSAVETDATRLSRLDRALFRFESLLTLAGGITIFALVCLAVVHVLSRKFLNAPVPGFVDWTEQFMAIFAFLGLAYTQREGGHIRMDIVVSFLRGRWLWLAEFLSVAFMLIITTALIYGTWYHFLRSFDPGAPLFSRDSSIDIALPLWPAKFLVTFSMALLWLRLALQLWAYGRAIRSGARHPVAVPLIETAAEAAEREAASVGAIHE